MIFPFSKYLYQDETQSVEALIDRLAWDEDTAQKVYESAVNLVEGARAAKGRGGHLESFLREFSLSTEEGLAMMTLAEALLRIPDARTANELIRDKVSAARWLEKQGGSGGDWMSKAAGLGMALTRKTLDSALARLGEPVIREAMIKAMQMMGRQFVLGTSIEDAALQAKPWEAQGYRMSYDILGEGARTAQMAEEYFQSYAAAIEYIGRIAPSDTRKRAGMSVKLSALHPRYSALQREYCLAPMQEKLLFLARKAAAHNIPLTVDAEESARLDLSLQVIEPVLKDHTLDGWDGFGVAVQAYMKRAVHVIDYLANSAQQNGRRIQIRLVKGAYWDSEIKRAQVEGLPEYPVFTRKCHSDISYLACAQQLLMNKDFIYPMFGTHNAHSVAAILTMARAQNKPPAFEFQRLFGMGEGLYAQVLAQQNASVSVYAPVGAHRDLLPYLVRRLLENGANSSFVNKLLDIRKSAQDIVPDPIALAKSFGLTRHSKIPLPRDIYGAERLNSEGIDLHDPASTQELLHYITQYSKPLKPHSIIEGKRFEDAEPRMITRCFDKAKAAFPAWNGLPADARSRILEDIAVSLEKNRKEIIAILVREAGKTIPDARDELREAVDFCRFYAAQGRKDFPLHGTALRGATGESNILSHEGRGVFVAISPWNFPLAIFTGQIVAALMAGNCVIAKPASQTRMIASFAVSLMHKAGVPENALHLLLGDGAFGGQIVAHPDVAGVVFTGSSSTAKSIQRALAAKDGAIVPLIAETGGQNAMIVDSSALPEQVVDDVLLSAFGSAGQRCSALRVLYLQQEIADQFLTLLRGAMQELQVGDTRLLSSDIGGVIDMAAKQSLEAHIKYLEMVGTHRASVPLARDMLDKPYFAPVVYEIPNIKVLKGEVFGPVLHVVRYDSGDLEGVIADINESGFGLTFGIHSRIQSKAQRAAALVRAGNVYVNRSMIGAVVGVQPFGGMGLSGTGPKAGGFNYLRAFATEKLISTNTTASGGNASLVMMDEND